MKRILRHVGGKDFRKTHQKKLDEQRSLYLEKREKEIREENKKKKIEEAAKPFKSNWRKDILREFGEWVPVANAGGPTMGTSTTFGYYVGGSPLINSETGQPITYTASGLGGVEALPTTVTIDQGFGDIANVDAPTYNQLALAGYAPMLPFFRRDDYKDVNAMLDASQEYAKRVLADVYMGARVELNRDIDRQEAERNEMMNKVSSYVSQLGIDFEELQKGAQIDKYGRLVVLNYDGGVLGGLKNSNNRSITIYNPAKDAQGNLLKIQDTGNKTLQKGETVFGTQYSPMPDESTVQTWSNVGDVAHFTDFGSGHDPNKIGEVLVGPKKVGPLIKDPNNPEYNKRFAPITAADELSILGLDVNRVLQNPQLYSRLLRSLTDNIRYGGSSIVTGLPSGITYNPNHQSSMKLQRWFAGRNYGTPLGTFNPGELNVSRMYQDTNQLTRGTPFGNKSGAYWVQPAPERGLRGIKNPFGSTVNRGWTGTPEVQIRQGGPRAVQASADDLTRLATKGTKTSKVLSRLVPGVSYAAAVADVSMRIAEGDYAGAVLGAISAWPGPPGWIGFGAQMLYDVTRSKLTSPYNRLKEAVSDEQWKPKAMEYLNTLDKDEYIRMLAAMLLQEGINPEFVSLTIRAFYGAELVDSEIEFIKTSLPKIVKYLFKKKNIKQSTTWDRTKKHLKGA